MAFKPQNLRLKTQLLLLCCIMVAGFTVFGIISFHAVAEIKVNGPVYKRIVQGKNLIADILPPPAYILESYLTLIQLDNETNRVKQDALIKQFRQLRKEYNEKYEFWQKNLPDGPMKEIITKKSHEPAVAFYETFENKFLPAFFSNDKNRTKAIKNELSKMYEMHRSAIDELVILANKHNLADEALAASIVRRREIFLIAIACITMTAVIAVAFLGIRRILTNHVSRLVSVAERFSSGDLTARYGLLGKDELSEVGRAFDQMAEKLVNAQGELVRKEKLAILGQLSGSVGNELRNPLGVMSNAVYYLQAVLPDTDDTVKEYLDIIKHEIDNSLRIITDLLDFARTKPPQTQIVAASGFIDKNLEKHRIPENITVRKLIPENLPSLRIDPQQMGQVLQNLITNAIQAMPDGGELRIAMSPDKSSECKADGCEDTTTEHGTLKIEPQIGFIEISVTDTGVGISEENMKKLFQPLFTTKARGIGLGLVVCKNLTEANGGKVKVESKAGHGTTFSILLPAEG